MKNNIETIDRHRSEWQDSPRKSIVSNPVLPKEYRDSSINGRSDMLVGRTLNIIFRKFEKQNRDYWLGKFERYKTLPKGKEVKYKKIPTAENFITETAGELLRNPQDINFMQDALLSKASNAPAQDPKQEFVQLVKDNCLTLIKNEWVNITPRQIAKLVSIYADDNNPSQDFAKIMLADYFKGPKGGSRKQRIGTYYNFVSGVLDLAEDDMVFREGMKIALHATEEILPKVPSLLEQTKLLNFPIDIKEEDFQKLLIARRIVARVCAMDLRNLGRYYQERADYMNLESTVIDAGNARKDSAIRHKGVVKVGEMYRTMKDAIRIIATSSREPSLEVKNNYIIDSLKPVELAFDPVDPLNQKFERLSSGRSTNASQVR